MFYRPPAGNRLLLELAFYRLDIDEMLVFYKHLELELVFIRLLAGPGLLETSLNWFSICELELMGISRDEFMVISRDEFMGISRDELMEVSRDELMGVSRDDLMGASRDELMGVF